MKSDNEIESLLDTEASTANKESNADEKFGGSHPFKTILTLSVLPAMFLILSSMHDAIDLILLRNAYDETTYSAIAISSVIKSLVMGISQIHSVSIPFKISQFAADHKFDEAGQFIVDYIRINVLIAIFIPILFLFIQKPFITFLGMPKELLEIGCNYLLPLYFSVFFLSTASCLRGVLTGIAKPVFSSLTQIFAQLFSLCISTPIICIALHGPVWTAQLAYLSGEIICCLILLFLFFKGKISINVNWNMFIRKPSKELLSGLSLCLPNIIIITFGVVSPSILMNKMLTASKMDSKLATVINVGSKPSTILVTILRTLSIGLPSAGTWAFKKNMFDRLRSLFLYSLIIPYLIVAAIYPFLIPSVNEIALGNCSFTDSRIL